MLAEVAKAPILSNSQPYLLKIKIKVEPIKHFYIYSGDDCVKTEYVEDSRVSEIWGLQLINNVNKQINRTKCDLFS